MDSIRKEVLVSYHKPSIQDIITMIPVMDELATNYRTYNKWIKERREGKDPDTSTPIEIYINKAERVYEQLCVLSQLGFYTSNNNKELVPPEEIII